MVVACVATSIATSPYVELAMHSCGDLAAVLDLYHLRVSAAYSTYPLSQVRL